MTSKRAGNIVNYSYQGSTKGYAIGDSSRFSSDGSFSPFPKGGFSGVRNRDFYLNCEPTFSCSKLEQCYKEEHSES